MRVLIDIDGVCLDMMSAIRKRDSRFTPEGMLSYDFKKGNIGIQRDDVFKYLSERETFLEEKPYDGVEQALSSGNVSYVGYTSVPQHITDIRVKQMEELGIDEYIIFSNEKLYVPNFDYVIDDCPFVLEKFPKEQRVLITHCYNEDYIGSARYAFDSLLEADSVLFGLFRM